MGDGITYGNEKVQCIETITKNEKYRRDEGVKMYRVRVEVYGERSTSVKTRRVTLWKRRNRLEMSVLSTYRKNENWSIISINIRI